MSGAWHSIEAWLVALTVTIAILAGFGIFARWCSFSPAVPRRKLEELRIGLSMDEVKRILGAPRDVRTESDGASQWVYGARAKRNILIIEFNNKAAVKAFAHGIPNRRRAAASAKD